MAEQDQEKSELPTGKRLDEARERGQVAISRELMGAVLFFLGVSAIHLSGRELVETLAATTRTLFALPERLLDRVESPAGLLGAFGEIIADRLMPVYLTALAAVLLTGFLQVGFRLSMKPLEPKLERLDPFKGVKKLFSLDNTVLTATSLLKLAFVGVVVWMTLAGNVDRVLGLADALIEEIVFVLVDLLFTLAFRVAAGLLLIGFIDLLYRRWKHRKDLMMSKYDVKQEGKQAEGDPMVKAKIREVQRKMALTRMKGEVERADVVVRNPTHFAVALKYEAAEPAPRVLAKGRALMALTIIRIAEEAGVEVVENRPLARELYRTVPVGAWIPERLFKAVAELLSYVYRKQRRRPHAGARGGNGASR